MAVASLAPSGIASFLSQNFHLPILCVSATFLYVTINFHYVFTPAKTFIRAVSSACYDSEFEYKPVLLLMHGNGAVLRT